MLSATYYAPRETLAFRTPPCPAQEWQKSLLTSHNRAFQKNHGTRLFNRGVIGPAAAHILKEYKAKQAVNPVEALRDDLAAAWGETVADLMGAGAAGEACF
jgi:hypothetical protein